MENVITLNKLIGLLLFCPPPTSLIWSKSTMKELACPVMGTIFLVYKTYYTGQRVILEKWFPLQGERGHSSYFRCFQKQNREEGETE